MFKSASFRLTLSYLGILMAVSVIFSFALYATSAREFGGSLRRTPYPVYDFGQPRGMGNSFNEYRDQRLEVAQQSLIYDLVGFNIIVLLLGGGASYWLARRTLQPIEDAMEAQSRFTADASHELRTPLTSIRSEIEVALREKKLSDTEARRLLESNLEEVKKLEALSNGLLSLARFSDETAAVKQDVKLNKVVSNATSKLEAQAKARDITIKTDVPDITIQGVEASLSELMVILIDNAIKYSQPGGTVAVNAIVHGNQVTIDVKDEGIGIKAADVPHIFDRFYRADASRSKQQADGYGLGLSIAKQIADMHKGQILVKSTSGEGSVFTVKLPLKQS